jgi:hypothetical protein
MGNDTHITVNDLRRMTDREGLILQGCGGDPQEWLDGINDTLAGAGILLDGDTFKDVSVFEHDGHTDLLFDMEDVKLDIGKLAMWRLQTHGQFHGTWLSDFVPNHLGGFIGKQSQDHEQNDGRTKSMLIINAKRNGYAPDQCGKTMTVGELMDYLEGLDPDGKIYLSHDKGYTYGSISQYDWVTVPTA